LSIHAGFFVELSPGDLGNDISSDVFYNVDKCTERFYQSYTKLNRLATEHGVAMYLENNVINSSNFARFRANRGFMMTDSTSILEMKKQLDFNLLLDLGHLYVSCRSLGKEFISEMEILAPYAEWFHISSNDSYSDLHIPLLSGCPIADAYFRFADSGVDITLETNGTLEDISASFDVLLNR
jgi:sugar phosphate isomerase/epimerase